MSASTKQCQGFRIVPFVIFLDFDLEGSGLKGLRSELSSVIERSRKGEIKQLELEHTITRLQEDVSSKTTQLLELAERLDDKTRLVDNLQLKLEQKNCKLSAHHKEMSTKEIHYEQVESQVRVFFFVC